MLHALLENTLNPSLSAVLDEREQQAIAKQQREFAAVRDLERLQLGVLQQRDAKQATEHAVRQHQAQADAREREQQDQRRRAVAATVQHELQAVQRRVLNDYLHARGTKSLSTLDRCCCSARA